MEINAEWICHTLLSADFIGGYNRMVAHYFGSHDTAVLLSFVIERHRDARFSREVSRRDPVEIPVSLVTRKVFLSKYRQKMAFQQLSSQGLVTVVYRAKKIRFAKLHFEKIVEFLLHITFHLTYEEDEDRLNPHGKSLLSPIDCYRGEDDFQDDDDDDFRSKTKLTKKKKVFMECCQSLSGATEQSLYDFMGISGVDSVELFRAMYHGKTSGIKYIMNWLKKSDPFDSSGGFTQSRPDGSRYDDIIDLVAWYASLDDDDTVIIKEQTEPQSIHSGIITTTYIARLKELKGLWERSNANKESRREEHAGQDPAA